MNRLNLAIIVVAATALLAIGTAQTRSKTQSSKIGRYQLISTPFKWLATDSEKKVVVDETNRLFRIDTATGETSVLQFTFTPDVRTFWMPVGK